MLEFGWFHAGQARIIDTRIFEQVKKCRMKFFRPRRRFREKQTLNYLENVIDKFSNSNLLKNGS